MPPPMTTAFAVAGSRSRRGPHTVRSTRCIACSKFWTWARMVAAARSPSPSRIASSRARCACTASRSSCAPVEGNHPDAQSQHVVLLERRLEQVVVRGAVDGPVDPLVELDQGLAVVGARARRAARRTRRGRPRRPARRRGGRPRARARRAPRRCGRARVRRRPTRTCRGADRPRRVAPAPAGATPRAPACARSRAVRSGLARRSTRPGRARVRRSGHGSRDRPCPRAMWVEALPPRRYISHILCVDQT